MLFDFRNLARVWHPDSDPEIDARDFPLLLAIRISSEGAVAPSHEDLCFSHGDRNPGGFLGRGPCGHILVGDRWRSREAQERRFREAIGSLIILDGHVWKKVSEPVIVVHNDVALQNGVWNGVIGTVLCGVHVGPRRYGYRAMFPTMALNLDLPSITTIYKMADWEDAVAAHSAIVNPQPERYSLRRFFEDVVIHDHAALHFDPVCSPVERIIGYAIDKFGSHVGQWSREAIGQYVDIKEGLLAYATGGDVAGLERACDLLSLLLRAADRLPAVAVAKVMSELDSWKLDDAGIALDVGGRSGFQP